MIHLSPCIVLYCIVSYCIVLYCIVLYCIVLYCIVLYCIVLYCIVLYCIVLYSSGWMSRCVSRGIITGINSNNFMRDVSSLVPTKQTALESSSKMMKKTSQITQFANSQTRYIFELLNSPKQEMNKLMCTSSG